MVGVLGLIALALGYFVFVAGSKEKEGLKLLGQVIGIMVMIGALLAVSCSMVKCAKYGYSMAGKGAYPVVVNCPMRGSSLASTSSSS
ncbi:MAG: hypothetical protein HY593_02340 [Candidatus Omnitrophica bacterium]|nr:hypothetical protein [Candidatus Omnitrophota bacterium]